MLLRCRRRSRRHPDRRRARRRRGRSRLLVLLRFLDFAIAAHLTFCHDRTPFCVCARRNVRASTQCALNCPRCLATFAPGAGYRGCSVVDATNIYRAASSRLKASALPTLPPASRGAVGQGRARQAWEWRRQSVSIAAAQVRQRADLTLGLCRGAGSSC